MLVKDIISEKELELALDKIAEQREYVNKCRALGFDIEERSMNLVFDMLRYVFCKTEHIRIWFFDGWQESIYAMKIFPKKSKMKEVINNADMAKFLLEEYGDETVIPYDFDQFNKYICALKESSEYRDQCYSLGLRISDHIKCVESAEFLLAGIMGERYKDRYGYTTLTWWIYEKEFGEKEHLNMYDKNDSIVPMTTVQELYDYLIKEAENDNC